MPLSFKPLCLSKTSGRGRPKGGAAPGAVGQVRRASDKPTARKDPFRMSAAGKGDKNVPNVMTVGDFRSLQEEQGAGLQGVPAGPLLTASSGLKMPDAHPPLWSRRRCEKEPSVLRKQQKGCRGLTSRLQAEPSP